MESLRSVLGKIRPTAMSGERERRFVDGVLARLRKSSPGAKAVLAGSFAKGTFLEGDKDVDIFLLFRHDVEKEALEGLVRAAVENAFPGVKLVKGGTPPPSARAAFYQIAYAEHPYVRVFFQGRKIDVVPAYEAGHGRHFELKSSVDRSQLHTEYVLSKMNAAQKDEVRLLKKFLKSNCLYGAEIRVQGYSGYLCELLMLKYGTFARSAEAFASWGERTFMDLEGKLDERKALEKFCTPLVVIDPVDPERNVSAVVSAENYSALIALARAFLSSKDKASFFSKREYSAAQLARLMRGRNIYCVSFSAPDVVDDVLWGQVRRCQGALSSALNKGGFEIIGGATERCGNEICILFEILNPQLPDAKLVAGPPLQFRADCGKFASQYGKFPLLIHGGRLCALTRRKARTPEEMLPALRRLPLPSHLSSARHAKLYKGGKAISNCREALRRYFSMQR